MGKNIHNLFVHAFFPLPASVVPLDMDELRDSVVSGRFNAVSSLVRGEAAEGPEGLKERRGDGGSGKEAGSRRDKADKE